MSKIIKIANIEVGAHRPFILIAGPCVVESRQTTLKIATFLKKLTDTLEIPFIFKASYDKANRTSIDSFRGLGMKEGLNILKEVKETLNIPLLSDVHNPQEIHLAAKVLDVLQIPAFLCRQTDLLLKVGASNKVVNVKKGQFLAPWDISNVIKKIESTGNKKIILTERGTSFGYNNLVSDFRSIPIMQKFGYPVIFDATHSVQQPGGLGHASGGHREFIPLLSRCAMAAGCDGIFLEVHFDPKKALSDGPNMLALDKLEKLLVELKEIDNIVKKAIKM